MTKQINKLHKLLFSLLILLLPVQLGKHFWPDWTRVLGLRLDYLSPTLYFTDILILGILISWLVKTFIVRGRLRRPRTFSKNFSLRSKNIELFFLFLGFSIFLLANCFFTQNQPAAFYKLIKILEFSLLGLYIAKNRLPLSTFRFLLSASIVYSSLLAIAQFINQRSIGGIFYWLGERSFTSGTPGIAQTIWNGQLLLRPYATFSHPNVLAGFLVISLLFLLVSLKRTYSTCGRITKGSLIVGISLGTIALFLTFSHTAWAVFGSGILILILCRSCEPRPWRGSAISRLLRRFAPRNDVFKLILILMVLVFVGSLSLYFSPIQSESITYRQDLSLAAIKMWQSSPLIGVGLNNFLVRLPEFYQNSGEIRWFQPAHNLFLMVLAETGLIGLISLIWFLTKTIRRLFLTTNYLLLTALIAILALGTFDHYFYTLQQGQLLFTLILGMLWSNFIQRCIKDYDKMKHA